MNYRYLAAAIFVALYIPFGTVFMAEFGVWVAVKLTVAGILHEGLAERIPSGFVAAPILLLIAVPLAHAASFLKKQLVADLTR